MVSLKDIARAWAEDRKKIVYSGDFPLDELWDVREYKWTRSTSRSGVVKVDGEWVELPGPEKWDFIKADMKKNGWDPKDTAWLAVGRDGAVLLVEGNHRLAIARELGIRKIPVQIEFRNKVPKGKKMAGRVASLWMERQARRVHLTFSEKDVEKLRKDFLTLSRNIKNIKTYDQALEVRKALLIWGERFRVLVFEKIVPKIAQGTYLEEKVRSAAYPLYTEVTSIPLRRDRITNTYWNWNEQQVLDDFLAERTKWFNRMRRHAVKTWDALKDVLDSVDDLSYSTTIPEQLELEGFSILVKGFEKKPSSFFQGEWDKRIPILREGLRLYKARAGKVLPVLITKQVPLVIHADRNMNQLGEYHHGSRTISIFLTAVKDPKHLAHVLAHEMAHHIWGTVLSGPAKDFWAAGVSARKDLDLREVLKNWPDGMTRDAFDAKIKKSDPELYIQLESLFFDHRFARKDLLSRESFEKYIQEVGPKIKVQTGLPTGYSSKNNEEAFCETVGRLVSYGSKTVPDMAIRLIKETLPSIRIASPVRDCENRQPRVGIYDPKNDRFPTWARKDQVWQVRRILSDVGVVGNPWNTPIRSLKKDAEWVLKLYRGKLARDEVFRLTWFVEN